MSGAKYAGLLVAVAAVLTLAAASTSGGSTNPSTTSPTPPALPCPPSGHSVDTKAMTAPTSTPSNADWVGVFERIFVKTGMNGAVSDTPHQVTYVSATANGTEKKGLLGRQKVRHTTVSVKVPMSSSHLHRHSRGKKPKVVNGVAQVELKVKGSTVERLKSDYERPLPVTVKVTYKLNGKPIAAGDVKHKHGTVEVDYQLTNATAKPVNVCFKGFNGAIVKKTVTEPAPIYAYFYLTLPKNVTQFSAPGSFLNADVSGVEPQWLVALFEPLGPTTQTIKVTMHTRRAKIPKAKLILEFVEPEALAGSAPAQSAAAVQKAQASAEAAAAKVQADVAALELKAGQPHTSKVSAHSRTSHGGKSKSKGTPSLSFGTPTTSLTKMQAQVGALGNASLALSNTVSSSTGGLATTTNGSIATLSGSTSRSVGALSASALRSVATLRARARRLSNGATKSARRSLDRLATELRRAIDTPSLKSITARTVHLQKLASAVGALAGKLAPVVSTLAGEVQNLVAALPTPVAKALALKVLFGQLSTDLSEFTPATKATAQFAKLQADVTAGQALANTVSNTLGQIQTEAKSLAGQVQTLQSDAASLETDIATLVTAAAANAEASTQAVVDSAVKGLQSRFARDIASARGDVNAAERSAQQQLAAAQTSAKKQVASARAAAQREVTTATNDFHHSVSTALESERRSVAAAERNVNRLIASVRAKSQADLKAAKANAKKGGQAELASLHSSAAQAEAAAKSALTKANDDYAKLLGLNQQAVAWELPGGDATGVTEQEGSLIYSISGS